MHRLINPRRHYEWGSTTALPSLLGTEPDGRPLAEIWMGAHPADPSTTESGTRLDRLVAADPGGVLGPVAELAGPRMPFMVKLLAAAAPLSLQVHPTAAQAEAGFRREDDAGVPLTDPGRSYRDRSAKPELLLALTEMEMLAGLRTPVAVREVLGALDLPELDPLLRALSDPDPAYALCAALTWLLRGGAHERRRLVAAVTARTRENPGFPAHRLVNELAAHHPGDVGVVAALFLHHVALAPGEVVFVAPGTVHSYLRGTGLEVMAASDNVLRAGLTTKHVDAGELLRLIDLRPGAPALLAGSDAGGGTAYVPPVDGLALWTLADGAARFAGGGPRIVVACAGRARVRSAGGHLALRPGESALLTHADGAADLATDGLLAVAHCPGVQAAEAGDLTGERVPPAGAVRPVGDAPGECLSRRADAPQRRARVARAGSGGDGGTSTTNRTRGIRRMAQWQAWAFRDGEQDVESLVGWAVRGRDGEVGTVDDASLDAGEGAIVVGSGPVFFGHMTLLPAGAVKRIDREERCLHVPLTREQIEGAPRRRSGTRFDDPGYRAEVAAYYGSLPGQA